MALSTTGYFTTGTQPGTVAAQGNYIPVTGAYATYNGATQYTNGTDFVAFYGGGFWGVFTAPNSGGSLLYSASGSTTTFPLTGWGTYPGVTAPAPTFAVITALSTTGYTASGAGTTAANGNYVPCAAPNATYNGATQYTNGTDFLVFGVGGYWYVYSAVNAGGTALYDVPGGSATNLPLTGWLTSIGAAPAPTFVDMAAAAIAASSISGISVISGIYSITF